MAEIVVGRLGDGEAEQRGSQVFVPAESGVLLVAGGGRFTVQSTEGGFLVSGQLIGLDHVFGGWRIVVPAALRES